MISIQHYPFVKDDLCCYRDAGFFEIDRRNFKRFFRLDQYISHRPHDYYSQIITIRIKGRDRLLSAMGHFLEWKELIDAAALQTRKLRICPDPI